MFTGIVQEVGRTVTNNDGKLVVSAEKVLKSVESGASIAVNGVCLTITSFNKDSFSVDLTPETLRRTNLGSLTAGGAVNLERAMAIGGELGGHLVQGHVDGTGRLTSIVPEGDALIMTFEAPPEIMKYIVEKGFIAVDGISLTVAGAGTGYFRVSVVDYTRKNTTLGTRKVGEEVNLEIDIIAKYVERFIKPGESNITAEYLKEHGF